VAAAELGIPADLRTRGVGAVGSPVQINDPRTPPYKVITFVVLVVCSR
jgi:hypothetical protein